MKIKRFNNKINENYKATDKILKVSVYDFDVRLSDIEKTQSYERALELNIKDNMPEKDAKKSAIYYGLEEYLYYSGNANFKIKLFDGLGNQIDDEDAFDTYVKNIKNYNL